MPKATLKAKEAVTHDTHRYVFERPGDIDFTPGQATELSLDRDGWRNEGRPFTFTSQPEDTELEFVIKSYPDHDGVTEQLPQLEPGDQVDLTDPFGAITDQGPGVFIAAGAGITPFISILRRRAQEGTIDGSRLIYSNKSERDIILREEWESMRSLTTVFTVTDQPDALVQTRRIDKKFLSDQISDFGQNFYLCGPPGFVDDVRDALKSLGAGEKRIVTEEGW